MRILHFYHADFTAYRKQQPAYSEAICNRGR